jgi:hypothetical protein
MSNILIAKATAALQESVASIIGCNESEDVKREALAETFSQFESYMERNGVRSDVAKARSRGAGGHRSLTGALIEHLHDRLERRREQHGYQKSAKESPMSSLQDIAKTHGVPGVVEIAKNIVDAEKSYRITEEEFVNLIDTAARVAHPALGARAFEKVYERNPVLAKAIAVIKAWPSPMSLTPTMVGGTDAMLQVSDANPDALQQLTEMAESQRRAGESSAQAFERVYLDPANRHLAEAERGQNRPQPTTIFPLPR